MSHQYKRAAGITRFLIRNYLPHLVQLKPIPEDLELLDPEFARIYTILVVLIHCHLKGEYLKSADLSWMLEIHRSHIPSLMSSVKEGLLQEKIILVTRRGKTGGYWLSGIPSNNGQLIMDN